MPSTALDLIEVQQKQLEYDYRQSKALAMSGLFPDARTAEAALAKILLGRDLGLNPTQSMTGIHIVEGKPQVSAVTLAAFVKGVGKDYRILRLDDEGCDIEFGPAPAPGKDENGNWLPWPESYGTSTFTKTDAERAGLTEPTRNGKPSNHTKYPRNMFYARAMSNGTKWFVPEATHGIPVYHEGEIESSRMLDGTPATEALPTPDVGGVGPLADSLPPDLRDRFWAAWGDAQDLRHGQVTVAAAQMSLAGQSPEKIEAWLERVEQDNDTARAKRDAAPVDAEVVKDAPDLGPPTGEISTEAHIASGLLGEDRPAFVHYDRDDDLTQDERLASLNVRLSDLYDRRDATEGALHSDEDEALADEIEMVEGMIRDAGGELP